MPLPLYPPPLQRALGGDKQSRIGWTDHSIQDILHGWGKRYKIPCRHKVMVTNICEPKHEYLLDIRLTSVSMMRPMKKESTATARMKSSLRCLRRKVDGYMSTTAVTRLSTHTNCGRHFGHVPWRTGRSLKSWYRNATVCGSHLTIQSQKDNHDEEATGPQRRERHHGHSAWISDEGQAWTCVSHTSIGNGGHAEPSWGDSCKEVLSIFEDGIEIVSPSQPSKWHQPSFKTLTDVRKPKPGQNPPKDGFKS